MEREPGLVVEPDETVIGVWGEALEIHIKHAGRGAPVVYLGSFVGSGAWEPFLDALAQDWTVHAVEFPGSSPVDRAAIHQVETYWDLVLVVQEALDGLGLDRPALIGHSFGGMVAADLAAHFPDRFSKLVLISALGLWSDEEPVRTTELIASAPEDIPGFLFHDPTSPAAGSALALPDDPDDAVRAIAAGVWAMACAGKFIWPIPDNGLAKRLHRITAETLVIWGREDKVVPVGYAERFGAALGTARVEILDACGHMPQIERRDDVVGLISGFLGSETA